MSSIVRNLIEYHGISTCNYEDMPYFKQMNVDYTFCVPTQKPDIEQIVRVWATPSITEKKIVETPKGISLEGQQVTGAKLMVTGDIEYKVQYVANEATQSLHTAHTTYPFCGYIVLPENYRSNTMIEASVSIEDIYSDQMDLRCIYNNITMMIIADIC